MFNKLRLKLTFINVTVVALLFAIFISGIFLLALKNMDKPYQNLMKNIATQGEDGAIDDLPHPARRYLKYIYVQTDTAGEITNTAGDLPSSRNTLVSLVGISRQKKEASGEIKWQDQTYRYLKVEQGPGQGQTLVFINTELEKQFSRNIFTALTLSGLFVLALVFFASLFMADRALVPVKAAWQRQKNFVADASHELRTPLAVIQTNLELVLGNPKETVVSQSQWLDNIQAETGRMAKLINDLLFLARADSNQKMLEMSRFPLHTVLQEAVRSFKPVASEKGITLETTLEPVPNFYADEARLKQLAVILLDNAVKHTPSGGRITLSLKKQGASVEISVTDTGEGMEKEHLNKIFERFYRIDKSRSRNEGGTGLGLSIAEWIVREHGGAITASSEPGRGTVIMIELPEK